MQIKRGIIFLHDWSVEFTFDRDERCKYEGMEEGKKMEQPDTRGNQNARRLVWLTRALDGRAAVVKTREGPGDSSRQFGKTKRLAACHAARHERAGKRSLEWSLTADP